MLARATGTENRRNAIRESRLFAELCVLAHATCGAWFRSASDNLPAKCMVVVMPVDGLRPPTYAKGIYTEGEQSSSLEQMSVIGRAQKDDSRTFLDGLWLPCCGPISLD